MRRTATVAIMMVAMAASAQQYEWGTPQSYVTDDVGAHVEVDSDTIVVSATMLDSEVDRVYVFDAGKLRMEINYFPFDVGKRLINALGERYGEPEVSDGSTVMWERGDTDVVLYISIDTLAVSYSDPGYTPSQVSEDASEL